MTIPGELKTSKTEEGSCKLTIPLHEKIFVTETFQDQTQNLVAVGLRSSVVIIELLLDEGNKPNGDVGKISHQVVLRIDHDSRVQSFAWSPETCLTAAPKCLKFATGGADHKIRLYSSDLSEGEDHDTVKVLEGHTDYVNSIVYQPENGSQVVSGSDDHLVILWDEKSGRKIESISFKSPIMSLNWHPDEVSKLLVAEKSGVLHILNIVSYHPILSLDCGCGPLSSADWSLYNNLLIAAAVRSEVIVWDVSKMAPISKKYMKQDMIKSVKMSPISEPLIATAGQPSYSIKVSNFNNNHLETLVSHQPIGGISWHPRKNLLVVGHDQSVSIRHITHLMQI